MTVRDIYLFFFLEEPIELKYEGNTTTKSVGVLYLCDWNADDVLNVTWQNLDPNVTVVISEVPTTKMNVDAVAHSAVAACFETNLKLYDLILMTSDWYHGHDHLQIIGVDSRGYYSQELTFDVYTLISPCGTYGHCSSDVDPGCTDTVRSAHVWRDGGVFLDWALYRCLFMHARNCVPYH